jgi:Uma2 family endonuclease
MLPIRCLNLYIYIYSYWYQREEKILYIEYPSRLHETAVNEIRGPLENAMKQQARESAPRRFMWKLDANLDMSCGDDQRDHAIPDLVVTDRSYAPYLVIEVAFSQTRDAVMAKARSWLSHPENIGVIVIDISEHPAFAHPQVAFSNQNRWSLNEWHSHCEKAQAADPWGPITVEGHRWLGRLSCTVTVLTNVSQPCGPIVRN